MLVEEEVKSNAAHPASIPEHQAQQLQQQQQLQSPGARGPATDDDTGAGVPARAPIPKGKGTMVPAAQVGRSTATLCMLDYDKP